MKTYKHRIVTENGSTRSLDYSIGNTSGIMPAHPLYDLMVREIADGLAEITEIDLTPTLADQQATALAAVDAAAENARGQFITLGAGQAMVYRQKQQEADLFLAGAAVATPLLDARAARLVVDPAVVAAEWQTQAVAWLTIAAAIEGTREAAKEAITVATDQAGLDAALTALNWPVPV